MRSSILFVALAVLTATPLTGQDPEVVTSPPRQTPIHHFEVQDWKEMVCSGATSVILEVPAGEWIEFPVGWIAADHGRAIQNWDCMGFEIRTGGRVLSVPNQGLNWDLSPVRFECADRTVEGIALSPVVYLPPVDGERTYQVRYIFRSDVNDGWSTFAGGSDLTVQVTFRALVPEEGGDGR